jgi:hypothetical protein
MQLSIHRLVGHVFQHGSRVEFETTWLGGGVLTLPSSEKEVEYLRADTQLRCKLQPARNSYWI